MVGELLVSNYRVNPKINQAWCMLICKLLNSTMFNENFLRLVTLNIQMLTLDSSDTHRFAIGVSLDLHL
jgi:hypothetical protein